jgi:hypothetical protein
MITNFRNVTMFVILMEINNTVHTIINVGVAVTYRLLVETTRLFAKR